MAIWVAALIRRISEVRERRTAAGPDSTPAWIHHHSAGYMALPLAPRGRPTDGDAFARKKLPRRLKASHSKPTTNLTRNHSPQQWRPRTSPPSTPHKWKETRRT